MPAQSPQPFDWKGFWDMASHVGTLIGLAIAGVWGYFNFIKSRTYYPRLEMTVSGELRHKDKRQYLVPRITLNNIGKSRVKLIQSGSGYRIWTANGDIDQNGDLAWSGGKPVYDLFANHKWIEPGETIFDELNLFELPYNCVAAKIQSRLVVPLGWPNRKNSEWNCSTIVGPAGSGGRGHE
jgi:hypothetical protein